MRPASPIHLLAFGVLLIYSVEVSAQPLCDLTPAIETMVINSDNVWIAKIVQVLPRKADDDRKGHDVVIAIEDRVKVERLEEPSEKMSVYLPYEAAVLQGWQERSSRVFIALTMYDWEQTRAIELAPETLEVMTADVKLLRDPDAVIQAAKAAVHRLPANVKRVHTFDLVVPHEVVAETRWDRSYRTGGHLNLSVPVDQELEKRAQDYVRSADPLLRPHGIRALYYFQSDENIELVRPFLNDPHFVFHTTDGSSGKRYYAARHAAYQTLKGWGLTVEPPVYREDVQ